MAWENPTIRMKLTKMMWYITIVIINGSVYHTLVRLSRDKRLFEIVQEKFLCRFWLERHPTMGVGRGGGARRLRFRRRFYISRGLSVSCNRYASSWHSKQFCSTRPVSSGDSGRLVLWVISFGISTLQFQTTFGLVREKLSSSNIS